MASGFKHFFIFNSNFHSCKINKIDTSFQIDTEIPPFTKCLWYSWNPFHIQKSNHVFSISFFSGPKTKDHICYLLVHFAIWSFDPLWNCYHKFYTFSRLHLRQKRSNPRSEKYCPFKSLLKILSSLFAFRMYISLCMACFRLSPTIIQFIKAAYHLQWIIFQNF